MTLAGRPAQVRKYQPMASRPSTMPLEGVEMAFLRSDRKPWLCCAVLPAERLLALIATVGAGGMG